MKCPICKVGTVRMERSRGTVFEAIPSDVEGQPWIWDELYDDDDVMRVFCSQCDGLEADTKACAEILDNIPNPGSED